MWPCTFWRTFHYDGKISPKDEFWGVIGTKVLVCIVNIVYGNLMIVPRNLKEIVTMFMNSALGWLG
jgi:hypothetical protein